MYTDPIADLLTRIRNACLRGSATVEVPASKQKLEIVKLLQKEGFIERYEVKDLKEPAVRIIRIVLKYDEEGRPVIRKIKRVSRPGLRKYYGVERLPRILSGAGIAVVSTNKGMLTDRAARRENVGGELLCYVY